MLTEPINSRMVGPASSSNALRLRGGVERVNTSSFLRSCSRQRGVSVKVAKPPKQFPCYLSSMGQPISSSQLYSSQTEHSQFAATRAIFLLSGITGWTRMLLPGCAC